MKPFQNFISIFEIVKTKAVVIIIIIIVKKLIVNRCEQLQYVCRKRKLVITTNKIV